MRSQEQEISSFQKFRQAKVWLQFHNAPQHPHASTRGVKHVKLQVGANKKAQALPSLPHVTKHRQNKMFKFGFRSHFGPLE